MSMQRWDPFGEIVSLRDAMERLFQESFVRPSTQASAGTGSLPLDLAENDDSYVVHATMPGVKPEDVQISIQGNQLTIRGETRAEEDRKDQNWIVHERRSSSFHRTVMLPGPVNSEQAEARYEHGILTLTLPKAEQSRPKQIKVRSAQSESALPAGTGTTGQQTGSQTNASQASLRPMQPEGQPDQVTEASEQSFPASDPPAY